MQNALLLRREPVEPRRDDPLDCFGKGQTRDVSLLENHVRELLRVQRIAART